MRAEETSVTDSSACRTFSALRTAAATSRSRARETGVRTPSLEMSMTSVMTRARTSSRLDAFGADGPGRVGRRVAGARGRRRLRLGPKLRRDAAACRRVVDARVVHAGQHARELLLHRLELRE